MTEQEPQRRRRRSRFVRTNGDLPGLRPGPRDAELLLYIYDFRFLTAAHLVALTGGDKTSVEKRLFKLWQHEYVYRRWDVSVDPLRRGPAIYQIDKKGAEFLAQSTGKNPSAFDWSARRNEVKLPFVQHALMVAHIRTLFTLAIRQRPELGLLFWRHDQETSDRVPIDEDDPIYNGVRAETVSIVPDGFFALRLPNGTGYCMLEADRSTMDHKDFLRKLRAYFLWWRSGGHTERFGIKRFIVLTVTLTKERAKNLFELSRQADDKKKGCGLFWFTTIDNFRLDIPEGILKDNIWVTWNDGQPVRVALSK